MRKLNDVIMEAMKFTGANGDDAPKKVNNIILGLWEDFVEEFNDDIMDISNGLLCIPANINDGMAAGPKEVYNHKGWWDYQFHFNVTKDFDEQVAKNKKIVKRVYKDMASNELGTKIEKWWLKNGAERFIWGFGGFFTVTFSE